MTPLYINTVNAPVVSCTHAEPHGAACVVLGNNALSRELDQLMPDPEATGLEVSCVGVFESHGDACIVVCRKGYGKRCCAVLCCAVVSHPCNHRPSPLFLSFIHPPSPLSLSHPTTPPLPSLSQYEEIVKGRLPDWETLMEECGFVEERDANEERGRAGQAARRGPPVRRRGKVRGV